MTTQQKSTVIKEFLASSDCSNVSPSGENDKFFSYEEGLNEGCYMTIGENVYRCHIADKTVYRNAVSLYLTMA